MKYLKKFKYRCLSFKTVSHLCDIYLRNLSFNLWAPYWAIKYKKSLLLSNSSGAPTDQPFPIHALPPFSALVIYQFMTSFYMFVFKFYLCIEITFLWVFSVWQVSLNNIYCNPIDAGTIERIKIALYNEPAKFHSTCASNVVNKCSTWWVSVIMMIWGY